jgi:predicted transglutaminase-like cysteine proteinase
LDGKFPDGVFMKIGLLRSLASVAVCLVWTTPGSASGWLKTNGQASRPFGHVEYCAKSKSDCAKRKTGATLPSVSIAKLASVNKSVNKSIKPVSDKDQYGTREKWVSGAKAGDCEDYALAKRAKLSRMGIPKSSLLLAVGRNAGEAHTVLVVRTSAGDFVLNNLTDDVTPIRRSTLGISKMQSPVNGAEWLRVIGVAGQSG